MRRWNIVALSGDTHVTESEQRYVYPLLMPNEITYITDLTRPVTYIIMLDERNDNECLHQHCGPRRRELARNNFANFVSNGCSLVDYVAHNLESFVVPLMPIRKIHTKKSNGNKTVKIVATRKEEVRTLLSWIHTNL